MWQYVTAAVSLATFGDWLLLVFGVLLTIYILGTWNYDYFKKRGIGSTKPKIPFVGDTLRSFIGSYSFFELVQDLYDKGEGNGIFGVFELTSPTFLIRDPEMIKLITVKEFESFTNHRPFQGEKADPIFSSNLFNLEDQMWRDMRATLSPAFTTSKIKGMFPLVSECGSQMAERLRDKYVDSKEGSMEEPLPIDLKDLFSRLANDVIATAAFGVCCNSLKQPENEFYRMGKRLTTFSSLRSFIFMMYFIFPKLAQALRLRVLDQESTHFFHSLVHETIRERRRKNILRPDMLQLLMQAREGQLKAEDNADELQDANAKNIQLSDKDISAQAIIFFFAGFETVSIALCLTSYLLSHHEDVQKRLFKEVEAVMEQTGGKPTYESIQGMKYIDAVINETLRLYPPTVATDRICGKDVQLPAGSSHGPVTIRKGQIVTFPISAIQTDPKYWDEPQTFNPDRFSDEAKHNIKPFTYMPFGAGPRLCIGQRFALIEVKIVLVHLLAKFELHPCAKTKHPLQFEPGFNVNAKGGFWCEIKPRDV